VTKYVATTSSEPLAWSNSVALRGDVGAEIARLKQDNGPTLLTQGSSGLLQTLLKHDLVDEFRLLTFPLLLGPGKRLFGQGTKPGALALTSTSVSTTGVIMSVYQRGGEIEIGSFELPTPSEAELARRERMKREG
jgi:dihydrofolate reductase